MKVFVTGGTGLVGRRLVPALLAGGHQVACLSRDPRAARAVLPAQAEVVGGDPQLPGVWQDLAGACQAVINLAGASVGGRWTAAGKARMRRSRLGATSHVAQALAAAEPGTVLISASAVGYYGDGGARALGEDSEPGSGFLARMALEWEHTAARARSDRVRVVLLRLGMVLDPAGGALPRLLGPCRWGLGGPLGSGRQYLPWIHHRDLVQIVRFCLEDSGLDGPVNAVAPEPPTQREFARALRSALGVKLGLPAPAWAVRAILGEQSQLILGGQRAVPNVLKARGYKFAQPDLPAALRDLLAD